MRETMQDRPHVVIVGGGFGGLTAARALARAKVRITLLDRTNHHLFQPLLYQVAMAGLSPAEIASPIRSILARQRNVRVLLASVAGVDVDAKLVRLRDGESVAYDWLILATGANTTYFGHEEWAKHAPGLKTLEDAIEIRRRVLMSFERAERETKPARRKELLTFVSIGGGPTGVELAGAVTELAKHVLARDFRSIDPKEARVVLVEAGARILSAFDEPVSAKAVAQLRELGVEVRTGARVTAIDPRGLDVEIAGAKERIDASTVVWGAGVRATGLGASLGVPLDRGGRVVVGPDCAIPGHPRVFAIGDMAAFTEDGKLLPGVSPVAMQQGRYVARIVRRELEGKPRDASPFRYFDKGTMATIGRSRAVLQLGKLRMSGFFAWVAWLLVHIWYLIGFRNRLVVMFNWAWSYFTYRRGARLITSIPEEEEAKPKG